VDKVEYSRLKFFGSDCEQSPVSGRRLSKWAVLKMWIPRQGSSPCSLGLSVADCFMNKLIVTAIRCSLMLLVPVGAYALSAQWATHGNKASKSAAHARPSQLAGGHSKRTAGRSVHASPAIHGKGLAGGNPHVQHMQTHQRAVPRARHQAGVSPTPTPTPTPTPATTATTPAPDLTATTTPSPTG
jgi:hypothetical protein